MTDVKENGRSSGRLSIVATPIGNLEDITLRALRVLRSADCVLAEDTRRTRKLCAHHGIETPLRAFHAHSPARVLARCLEELDVGRHLAVVSDAGTPLISDPGFALVEGARNAGIRVEAIPGPSAVAAALCVCGIPFSSYRFVGFVPRSGRHRQEALRAVADARAASVLFEAPARTLQTLEALGELLGPERRVAVCRELTKLHEEVVCGRIAEVVHTVGARGVRGEVTIVIEGAPEKTVAMPTAAELDAAIDEALRDGLSPAATARTLAARLGVPRKTVYGRIVDREPKTPP